MRGGVSTLYTPSGLSQSEVKRGKRSIETLEN